MKLLLARIDDRLIHGQVVDGCCESLPVGRLMLAHDQVATDERERALFAAAGPDGIPTEILSRETALERLAELEATGELVSTALVTESPADMLHLVEAGGPIEEVTIGGMHRRAARPEEIWSGFFVGAEEREALLKLLDRGIHVVFQTVPGSAARDLRELLKTPNGG